MLDHLGSLSTIKRKVHKPVSVDDRMDGFEFSLSFGALNI